MAGKAKYIYASVLGVILLASGFTLVRADSASSTTVGSADDPLVTKSYVDQLLKGVTSSSPTPAAPAPAQDAPPAAPAASSTSLTVVQLQKGETLYAAAGSEFIVRTGRTVAVSSDENGIPDITSGKDLASGALVENNHLLIFPHEGRGIKPSWKNTQDIYVMVRGGYTLVDADGNPVPAAP